MSRWHLVKFNTTVAVNFSNSTVGNSDRQCTIILFISNIFLPTILNYLNDSEGGGAPLFFVGFWRPAMPPPPPQTPQYLTILMTERGRHYLCRILAPPMTPPLPTPQFLTVLMTERGGAIIFCRILAPPQCPPPPHAPQYLTILMTGRGGR